MYPEAPLDMLQQIAWHGDLECSAGYRAVYCYSAS